MLEKMLPIIMLLTVTCSTLALNEHDVLQAAEALPVDDELDAKQMDSADDSVSGWSLLMDVEEWRDNIVKAFGDLTKFVNRREFVKYRGVFANDAEMLWPGVPMANTEDMLSERNRYVKEHPVNHIYVSFVELLYSSPDVAIVRAAEFAEFIDGTERTAAALALFIQDGNDVRMKLGIYTME